MEHCALCVCVRAGGVGLKRNGCKGEMSADLEQLSDLGQWQLQYCLSKEQFTFSLANNTAHETVTVLLEY